MENNIISILEDAKSAFIENDHVKVQELLTPLSKNENSKIAGASLYILGLSYYSQKNEQKAFEMFEKAVSIGHDDVALYEGYGAQLQHNAQYDKAEEIYNKGLNVCGRVPTLLSHLSTIKIIRGHISQGEELLKEALKIDDNNYLGWTNLGNVFQQKGYYKNAIFCYKEALKIKENYEPAISNLLLTINYSSVDREEAFLASKEFASKIDKPLFKQCDVDKNCDRKIRVGYISADFKTHSVSYFFAPLLFNHDREKFEIYCYSDVYSPDPVTIAFQEKCDFWRDSARLSNEELSNTIYEDKIDILVDLAGHAGGKRLALFRAKVAPIQITYLGYPNTTGLEEFDIRIVDTITDPDGDEFYTEKLERIESPFIAYLPPSKLPIIQELPAIKNGYITFGSCNNLAKLSDETVEIWSEVLQALPNSLLKLKSKPLVDDVICNDVLHRFENYGIDTSRISLEGHRSSNASHLDFYNSIDVALDCFPYNGTTTTCEALLMGVPVLTILGDRHSARVSASLLNSVGISSFIAKDSDEMVDKAQKLSDNISLLQELRLALRDMLNHSPLTDGKRVTQQIENIYINALGCLS